MPSKPALLAPPQVLVVMGVSGAGKSTTAALLAGQMHWHFEDGDTLHPIANIEKMRQGLPLDDEDRRPWLQAVARIIDGWLESGDRGVVACSALKRAYRQQIVGQRRAVRLVYLKGSRELILHRLAARHGHFMPISLLDTQLQALEEPLPEEHALVISIQHTPEQIACEIETRLQLQPSG